MMGIQVSLMAALSPEPAKVAALEPTDSLHPAVVVTAAALLPGAGSQASSWDGRHPQKVDATSTASSEEAAFAALAAEQPRKVEFPPPGLGLGETTTTCSATNCSSPDRSLAACSRSSSDQDQDFATAVGCDALLLTEPQVSTCTAPALRVSCAMQSPDPMRTTLLATQVTPEPNLHQSQVPNTQNWPVWPNRGSVLHMSGMCQPCAWFWKPVGCQSSLECNFCHVCPDGVLKARKKTKQAMKRMGLLTPKAGAEDAQKEARHALSLASLI